MEEERNVRMMKLYGSKEAKRMFDQAVIDEMKEWIKINKVKEKGVKKKLNINTKRD